MRRAPIALARVAWEKVEPFGINVTVRFGVEFPSFQQWLSWWASGATFQPYDSAWL
jgi:hypothetical protein